MLGAGGEAGGVLGTREQRGGSPRDQDAAPGLALKPDGSGGLADAQPSLPVTPDPGLNRSRVGAGVPLGSAGDTGRGVSER